MAVLGAMPKRSQSLPRQQRGATLIVCMIILVVITFMGVGSIQDTTMEEKMAGNMKNRNMAFQAAESGLRDAEGYLSSTVVLPAFNGTTSGLIAQISGNDPSPYKWSDSDWTASSGVYPKTGGDSIPLVSSQPRLVIEKLESVEATPDLEAGQPADTTEYFKITVKAVGGTSSSVVIVESIYKR
ncbi:MAG: PilX N-terminal domain-containing pilus assembly protein [Motiliproteus sp.]